MSSWSFRWPPPSCFYPSRFCHCRACLNRQGLILAGIASVGLALCAWNGLAGSSPPRTLGNTLAKHTNQAVRGQGWTFCVNAFSGGCGHDGFERDCGDVYDSAGDSYHFDRLLFWRQNQSIEPFVTYNPWINATSFAGEALGLPGFVCCKNGAMLLGVVWLAGVLSLGVVFSLARRLGCSPRASVVAAMLPLGIPAWHQYFIEADTANVPGWIVGRCKRSIFDEMR